MYNLTMRILLIAPEYPPYTIGGGGEVYKNLAEGYCDNNNEVSVLYGYYPNTDKKATLEVYKQNGINFIKVPEIPYPKDKSFLKTVMPPTFNAFIKLFSVITKASFDIAHLHGYGWPLILICGVICKFKRIPYIFTIHGYPETQNKQSGIVKLFWNILIKFIQDPVLKSAKYVTGVSDYIREDKRNISKNTVTIYNGIDAENFKIVEDEYDIRTKLGLDSSAFMIFSLGRISEMKGFQKVIELLPNLLKSNPNLFYIIAGEDGGYLESLRLQIKNLGLEKNVLFVGQLDSNTKKMYLKQSDLYAIPSLREPFGLVALEGLVFEKLIMSYEVGGLKEILKSYNNKINMGEVFNLNNVTPKKTTNALEILENFQWKKITEKYLKLLSDPF